MEPINLHVDGAGTVSRWSRRPDHGDYTMVPRADYDALVARVEKLRDEGFAMYAAYHAALKQRDEARALLREARGCVAVNYGPNEFSRLLARIDRCLEDKA